MNIGQRINKFDESNGTVKEFNKLFPFTKLKYNDSLEVEILNISRLGNELVREISISGEVFEHSFEERMDYSMVEDLTNEEVNEIKKIRGAVEENNRLKYIYVVESPEGKRTEFKNLELASESVNMSISGVYNIIQKGTTTKKGCKISRRSV